MKINLMILHNEICSLKKQRTCLIALLILATVLIGCMSKELNKTQVYVIDNEQVTPVEKYKGESDLPPLPKVSYNLEEVL